jgi:hypothetical protein
VTNASHTLISGKVNEVMNLFVGKVYVPAGGRNQWRIEAESPARASRFSFLHGAFDAAQDQLAGRASLARGGFVQPAVQIARHVDTGAD